MLRCNCRLRVASLLKILWGLFKTFILRAKTKGNHTPNGQGQRNWDADWQDFSVSVIPNTGAEAGIECASQKDIACLSDDVVNVVLNEMQPVLKRTKMIRVKSCNQEAGKRMNFAVQEIIQQDVSVDEMGTWTDDKDSQSCWEDELSIDEGNLLQATASFVKENRRKERYNRHQTNDSLRAQQRTLLTGPSLGVKSNNCV